MASTVPSQQIFPRSALANLYQQALIKKSIKVGAWFIRFQVGSIILMSRTLSYIAAKFKRGFESVGLSCTLCESHSACSS